MKYFTAVLLVLRCAAKVLGVSAASAVGAFLLFWSGIFASKVEIAASHETTRLMSPSRADGSVDYMAELDSVMREGVTPENNALPVLLRALGPSSVMEPEVAMLVYERLGMTPLPLEGDYLVSFESIHQAITDPIEAAKVPPYGAAIDVARIERMVPAALRERIKADFDAAPAISAGVRMPTMTAEQAFGPNTAPQPAGPKSPETAYEFLLRMGNEGMAAPWNAQTHPLLEAWIIVNEKPLRLLKEASRLPRFYWPCVDGDPGAARASLIGALYPPLGMMRPASRLLVCHAMRRIEAGDFSGAWTDLLAVYRLARLLGQHPFDFSQWTAIWLDAIADDSLLALAGGDQLPAPLAREWAARRQSLPAATDMSRAIDLGERYVLLDSIAIMSTDVFDFGWGCGGRIKSSPLTRLATARIFDANHAMQRSNAYLDAIVEALGHDDYRIIAARAQAAERKSIQTSAATTFHGEPAEIAMTLAFSSPGERRRIFTDVIMAGSMQFSAEAVVAGVCTSAVTGDLAVVALLLRAHRVERGEYPLRLAELSDAGIAIPRDRFDREPLRYRRTTAGYLLYSVGSNLLDEGGEHRLRNEWRVDLKMETFEGRRLAEQ